MQELKLLGVHDDEEHLVVVGADGEKYLLEIDETLYAAVRRDRTRLGQLQAQSDPARPRDIQAQIRSGLTSEEVADQAGVPLEQVRRYEGPVLAERAHIADQAGKVLVYSVDDPRQAARPLSELVIERLQVRDVDVSTAQWDAWKKPDGQWYVELSFVLGSKTRTASWTYHRGSMTPEDDEARWLADAGRADAGPIPGGPALPRTLSAVQDNVYNVDADGGVVPAGGPAEAVSQTESNTARILDTLNRRRGRRLAVDPDADESDPYGGFLGDEPAHPNTEEIPAAHPAMTDVDSARDAEIFALPGFELRSEEQTPVDDGRRPDDGNLTEGDDTAPPRTRDAGKPEHRAQDAEKSKGKRSSVPSWEEIMFGAKRD